MWLEVVCGVVAFFAGYGVHHKERRALYHALDEWEAALNAARERTGLLEAELDIAVNISKRLQEDLQRRFAAVYALDVSNHTVECLDKGQEPRVIPHHVSAGNIRYTYHGDELVHCEEIQGIDITRNH